MSTGPIRSQSLAESALPSDVRVIVDGIARRESDGILSRSAVAKHLFAQDESDLRPKTKAEARGMGRALEHLILYMRENQIESLAADLNAAPPTPEQLKKALSAVVKPNELMDFADLSQPAQFAVAMLSAQGGLDLGRPEVGTYSAADCACYLESLVYFQEFYKEEFGTDSTAPTPFSEHLEAAIRELGNRSVQLANDDAFRLVEVLGPRFGLSD